MHLFPGTAGLLTAVGIFLFWLGVGFATSPPGSYTFESRGPGSFEPRLQNYTRLTELLISLATGSIVLLAGSSILRGGGGKLPWFYGSPLVLLGSSVVLSVVFVSVMVYFYEEWLHDTGSYEQKRHVLVAATGFAALTSFAIGYVWLAFALANS